MGWVITASGIFTALAASPQPAPVEVMVVGSYHFASPGQDLHNPNVDNVLAPKRQRELQQLSDVLAQFKPTKIMVERVAPDLIDPNYPKFTAGDLSKNKDERAQIGYRLARKLGHETVYAIDEQPATGEPDYFPFGKIVEWSKRNGESAQVDAMMAVGAKETARIEQLQATRSVAGALAELNQPAKLQDSQRLYYGMLEFGDADQQPGADLNAMWYLRNAKIFAKLMLAAKPGDRVLVVYGVGHSYWLQHFAATTLGYRNVDPTPYLEQAAGAGR